MRFDRCAFYRIELITHMAIEQVEHVVAIFAMWISLTHSLLVFRIRARNRRARCAEVFCRDSIATSRCRWARQEYLLFLCMRAREHRRESPRRDTSPAAWQVLQGFHHR